MTRRTIVRLAALSLTPLLSLAGFPANATAQEDEPAPTRVNVHVVARDAKLIGTTVGGAEVVVRDAASGEILARGVHDGGTGDTDLIMGPRERNADVFTTPGAAVYTAALPLEEPRRVRIEASGPLDYPAARTTASTTLLLSPGRNLDGDGVVLELWGYIVEILEAPETVASGEEFGIRARVRMLCSCPTEPGGLWEAGDVTAHLWDPEGNVVAETPLDFTGETNEYAGRLAAPQPGAYDIEVTAISPETGNAGRARGRLRVNRQQPAPPARSSTVDGHSVEVLTDRIDVYVRPFVESRLFNGIILIAQEDSVLAHRAYGTADYALDTPMTRGMRFKIGSITKDVTAAAVLMLEDEGRIDRDDPVADYLPDFAGHPAITIRHLLEHTHGIPDWRTVPDSETRRLTGSPLAQTVRWLAAQPAEFEPGSQRRYGSSSYLILAYLIEAVTGEDYFAFVSRRVLTPAGLERTKPLRAREVTDGLVRGYENASGAARIRYPAPRHPSLGIGASYLVSTASDLLRWSRAAAERLDWPIMTENGRSVRWTSGMSGGYVARIHQYLDDDFTVVLLSNVFNAAFRPLMSGIAAIVRGDVPREAAPEPAASLSRDQLRELTGTFRCEDGGFSAFEIVATEDGVAFAVAEAPGETFAAWPINDSTIFVPTDFGRVVVETAADGRRVALYDGGFRARCAEA